MWRIFLLRVYREGRSTQREGANEGIGIVLRPVPVLATTATVGLLIRTLFVCAHRIVPVWLAAEASAQGQTVTWGKGPIGRRICQFFSAAD